MMRNKKTKMTKQISTRETSALGENNIERNWPTVRTKEKVLSFGGFVIEANVCGEYNYILPPSNCVIIQSFSGGQGKTQIAINDVRLFVLHLLKISKRCGKD